MLILFLIYAAVVLIFATVSLIAMHRAVAALRTADPALYRAARTEISLVPVEAGPFGFARPSRASGLACSS